MQVFNKFVTKKNVREVKYFHPNGQTLPNGSHIQRGGFLHECQQNKNAYTLDQSVHGQSSAPAQYHGGIITFPAGVAADPMSRDSFLTTLTSAVETFNQPSAQDRPLHRALSRFRPNGKDQIVAYSLGHSFHGTYLADHGTEYNPTSLSLELNGLSTPSLLRLASRLATTLAAHLSFPHSATDASPHSATLHSSPLLLKDLNTSQILLITPAPLQESKESKEREER